MQCFHYKKLNVILVVFLFNAVKNLTSPFLTHLKHMSKPETAVFYSFKNGKQGKRCLGHRVSSFDNI